MTDSVRRKPEDNSKEKILARMDQYGRREAEERTEFADLPTWTRTAAAFHDLLGLSWREAAAKVGKKPGTLDYYKASPAFRRWRAELQEAALDSQVMAEMVLKAHAAGITVEYLAAYQKAIEVGDYNAVAKISQDLLDRANVTKKSAPKTQAPAITINLDSRTLEIPLGDSSVEIEEGDFEVVDD